MPAWRRTKLVHGLYDEPVSEHLRPQLAELGPRARVRDLPHGDGAVPGLEAWLGEALSLALQSVAKAGTSPSRRTGLRRQGDSSMLNPVATVAAETSDVPTLPT